MDAYWQACVDAGGNGDAWQPPHAFEKDPADAVAKDLPDRCVTNDPGALTQVEADLSAMGISAITLLSAGYDNANGVSARHNVKIQERERRRREVRRDYDALLSARPLELRRADHDIPDAEVIGE